MTSLAVLSTWTRQQPRRKPHKVPLCGVLARGLRNSAPNHMGEVLRLDPSTRSPQLTLMQARVIVIEVATNHPEASRAQHNITRQRAEELLSSWQSVWPCRPLRIPIHRRDSDGQRFMKVLADHNPAGLEKARGPAFYLNRRVFSSVPRRC